MEPEKNPQYPGYLWWQDPTNWRDHRWIVQRNNVIGSWCVTLDRPGTPGDGNTALADFVTEDVARHLADIHNEWYCDRRDAE